MVESQPAEHPQRSKVPNGRPTIGYLAPALHEDSQPQWLGVVDAAQEQDVNLICFPGATLCTSPDSPEQANILYDLAGATNVDGLVSWASSIGNLVTAEEIEAFHKRYHPLPVVVIGRAWEGIPGLSMESYQGMYAAVTHLIEVHHCHRLAFIRGPENHIQAQARYQAYLDALSAHGLPVDPRLVTPPTESWARSYGQKAICLLLDERRLQPPVDLDAIVAANDGLILGALPSLQARGIQVPDDLAVVGFDNTLHSRVNTPPLTTVAAPYYPLGRQAIDTVLALLEGQEVSSETLVPAQLVVRQSCGCLDPAVAQAKLEPGEPGDEMLTSLLSSRRTEMIAAVKQALGDTHETVLGSIEPLLAGLDGELTGETPGLFIRELNRALRQTVASGGDVAVWHGVISALRYRTRACVRDQAFILASDLWQQARVVISETVQRAQAYKQVQMDQRALLLRETGAALLNTFDIQGLIDTLARSLPDLDIPGCYLVLYEAPQPYRYPQSPPEWARLVLAYSEQGSVNLGAEGYRFPTRQLLPVEMLPSARRYSLVVEPLFFQNSQIGFVLFEMGPREADVYDTLRVQMSSALQGATLIRRMENRALQFQAIAQVSRVTSSILELDALLQQVVDVIQEQFGLYYVGLFLTEPAGTQADASSRWAILRAGTGEAGRQMIAQGHRLEIGDTSMVGWAISQRQARIALDVGHGEQVVRFDNPLLPATRSEMALPLISRGEVIGALDVQSVMPEAFTDEDVAVLQTMADQVALAIGNVRLFQQVQDSLEAERRAYGELSREAWRKLLQTRSDLSFVCDEHGLMPVPTILEPHMQTAVQTGAVVVAEDDQQTVALPIKVRDQVIGVINAHKPEQGAWAQEQLVLLETLTEQLGVALESARLYQDTQRRAAREQISAQVTARMRESLDMETVLRTAVAEMRQALGLEGVIVQLARPEAGRDAGKMESGGSEYVDAH
ncbi:MAG TPA: substrate-binding domain-containing protein [Anaerolineae bacterium]|nr:substrate-binding domain-containing protein [Anaerolineae bacterium]HQH37070.1 substrate-binding domain-containing protein [Anaerolineae bacterium]